MLFSSFFPTKAQNRPVLPEIDTAQLASGERGLQPRTHSYHYIRVFQSYGVASRALISYIAHKSIRFSPKSARLARERGGGGGAPRLITALPFVGRYRSTIIKHSEVIDLQHKLRYTLGTKVQSEIRDPAPSLSIWFRFPHHRL